MSRVKKLLLVSFVLAVGIGLAWPFRKGANQKLVPPLPESPTTGDQQETLSADKFVPGGQRKQVVAQMASTAGTDTGTFDIENHPAIANHSESSRPTTTQSSSPADLSPVTPDVPPSASDSRPAFATSEPIGSDQAQWPEEVVHVVKNGDTLEKLAEHYLEDAGRALELFDLNRDQLTNPHLLPIGAELRIPIPRRNEID